MSVRPLRFTARAAFVAATALALATPAASAESYLEQLAAKAKKELQKVEGVKLAAQAAKAAEKAKGALAEAAKKAGVQNAPAAINAVVNKVLQAPALVKLLDRGEATLTGFLGQISEKLELVSILLGAAKDYPAKLAELRALRLRLPPVATGFDPARALSPAGKAALNQKAAKLEFETEARHVHGGVLYKEVEITKSRQLVAAYALGDSSYHNGQYLAARAYKFGVTGAAADLAKLQSSLLGAYTSMTIASAPSGRILNPRTGQLVAPRQGLPVRGWADDASPYFKNNPDLDANRSALDTYVYEGTLPGQPGKRFRFMSDVSRDSTAGLMLGLSASYEVLARRNASPEWRARIQQLVGTFVREFVKNGYRIVDLTGKPTLFGDGSNLKDPVTLLFNLNWLKIGAELTGAADLKGAYDHLVRQELGPLGLKGLAFTGLLGLLTGPMFKNHPEAVRYAVSDYNYNLLMLTIHPVLRLERNTAVRQFYLSFLDNVIWPLVGGVQVPFFDAVYQVATGKQNAALTARMAGVLGQFRGDLVPFGNYFNPQEYVTDFSGRADLRDPLFDYLNLVWERDLKAKMKGKDSPVKSGGGTWPLGPGLVPADNNLERATPFRLKGTGVTTGDNLWEYAAHDFLLSYWYARYFGLL